MAGKTREERVAEYLRKIATPECIAERIPAMAQQDSALESMVPRNDPQLEIALSGLNKVQREEGLRRDEADALEEIILPKERPVVFVQRGTYSITDQLWSHFETTDIKSRIVAAIPSIGRVELPDNRSIPYGGTGFIVGPGLMMTNRHVAELFAQGLGTKRLSLSRGCDAGELITAPISAERLAVSGRIRSGTEDSRPPLAEFSAHRDDSRS